jgi:hypothetical protein
MVCFSQAGKELASSGVGALLVSLFNVAWGCYALAGGVEMSEFYLFVVVFPARCISSISPRFFFRKHAFSFLPLVTILESPNSTFLIDFLCHHFPLLTCPGDLPMILQSEDFTKLLEVCNLRNGSRLVVNMVIMRKAMSISSQPLNHQCKFRYTENFGV